MLSENKTRIAVLVSGGGTNLQALIDAEKAGRLQSGEIALVASDKADAYALVRAQSAGIPAQYVSAKEAPFEEALSALLCHYGIKLVVLAGFMRILSADFVGRYPNRMINIHPSLIPSFCGKGYYGTKVHEAALACGVKVTGATVHLVNEVPDAGEILLQKAVDVLPGDTPETLQRRVMEEAEWILLPEATEYMARRIQEER